MMEPVTIYVDTALGYAFRAPGVVRASLGRTSVQGEEAQAALDLVMPIDIVPDFAAALARVAANARGSEEPAASSALTMANLVTMALLATAASDLAVDLGRLIHGAPGGAERIDEIERHILNNARNAVTEGVAIEDEAMAMGRVVEMLQQVFGNIRGQRPDEDQPDGHGSGE